MERNYIKGLPMEDLERLRPYYWMLAKIAGKRLRVRYRGPRYDSQRGTCLKRDARSWAVYFD